MNALLNYRLGEGPPQDRIWAHVTDLAPCRAVYGVCLWHFNFRRLLTTAPDVQTAILCSPVT